MPIVSVAVLASAALAPAASRASIIVPTYISGTNVNSDTGLGFDPSNTTTDAGLSTTVGNRDSLAVAQGATFSASDFSQYWETNPYVPAYYDGNLAPSLVFDVGANKNLSNLVLWEGFGGNDNQLANFTVSYSNDGINFSGASAFTLGETLDGSVPTPAQTFALGGVNAHFVQLTLTSNYYGAIGNGGDRVGYGKIRFDGSAVPEASTWSMMIAGFAIAGMVLRRRRALFAQPSKFART